MIVSHVRYYRRDFSLAYDRKLISLELIAALSHFLLVWTFSLYVKRVDIRSANNDYLKCADWRNSWEIRIGHEVFRPDQIPFFLLSLK